MLSLSMAEVARVYEGAESSPLDPDVRRAYAALIKEVAAQFAALPVRVVFTADDPYAASADLFRATEGGTMRVFTGGSLHPLMTKEENARFRAVHDYYGHFLTRGGFGPLGETAAWRAHRAMFSAAARPALDTETIGQVAVYFFGSRPRQYAEQKAFCFPKFTLRG